MAWQSAQEYRTTACPRGLFLSLFLRLGLISVKPVKRVEFCLRDQQDAGSTQPFYPTKNLTCVFLSNRQKMIIQLWFMNTVEPACKVSVLSNENCPYKRADLISGLLITIRVIRLGPAKNWPYKRVDLTSVDHISGRDCNNTSLNTWAREEGMCFLEGRPSLQFDEAILAHKTASFRRRSCFNPLRIGVNRHLGRISEWWEGRAIIRNYA